MVVLWTWNRSRGFWCAKRFKAPSFHDTLTLYSFWVSLNCHAWCHWNSELLGLSKPSVWMGRWGMEDSLVARTCSVHEEAPRPKFTDKIIVNFKMASIALDQAQSPSACGARCGCTGWAPVKLALSFLEDILLRSGHSSVPPLCCVTPTPLFHFQEVTGTGLFLLSSVCLMGKPETWISRILSLQAHQPLSMLLWKHHLTPLSSRLLVLLTNPANSCLTDSPAPTSSFGWNPRQQPERSS